jgi:hypothetical protein
MAESERKLFAAKELTEMLLKYAGIHEGHWALAVEFGFGAGSMALPGPGPESDFSPKPTAMVSIIRMGIERSDNATPLTTDAAKVNPPAASSE